ALARRHVADERRVMCDRQVRAGETAQHTAHRQGPIPHPGHRDARGVDGAGALADRAQTQAEARAVHEPGDGGYGHGGNVHEQGVAAQDFAIDQAEAGTAAVAAAANAAASILPSRPMSTMPERSAKSPPSAASTSGAAPRAVAAASSAMSRRASLTVSLPA